MQYLLTAEEYQTLLNRKEIYTRQQAEELQKFCTLVADTMPIVTWMNDRKPTPWTCILTTKSEWYCDECPARKVCPHPSKEWSK